MEPMSLCPEALKIHVKDMKRCHQLTDAIARLSQSVPLY